MIQYYLSNGVGVLGIEDGNITVVDEEDLED